MLLRLVLAAACLSTVAFADDYSPILLRSAHSRAGAPDAKLALFVPGGKVPPQDYAPFLQDVLDRTQNTNLFGAIVHCGKLNLCDPLGQLPGLIASAIAQAGKELNNGTEFLSEQIFVMGHSLGGVGARHYADTFDKARGAAAFAGLALFGTQYNGDHEDFKGTLGYPMDLNSFPAPLIAVVGELDMVPAMGHVGTLVDQWLIMSPQKQANKPLVVVPGMDHSQFCSPFNVSGDLAPEISNAAARAYAAGATAAWVDNVVRPAPALASTLNDFVQNASVPITRAWREASALEAGAWCAEAQKVAIGDLPAAATARVDMQVVTKTSGASLEHFHTNYTLDPATGRLGIFIGSYAYYPQNTSWNPVRLFGPTYQSARDISCKLMSADRIAQQLNVAGQFPQKIPPVPCSRVNAAAVERAMNLLGAYWPAGVTRFARRGLNFTFADDSSTFAGPQWVFLSSLSFKPSSTGVTVSSPRLYSSITSKIYPGNFYCKVLSPAKALEWIQSKGLAPRFK